MGFMDMFADIKAGKIGSLYLFYGPEEFTKEQALSQMTARLVNDGFKDLNYQLIDGTETSADAIIAASDTLPFMSEKRIVVVKNYTGLNGRKSSDEEPLRKYLEKVPDSTCLIFYCRGDVDKNRIIFKAIKKCGNVVEFERLKSPELTKWTLQTLRRHGKEISAENLNYLLSRTGSSLEDINNEIQKIVSYIGPAAKVEKDVIDKLIVPSPEYTVFQLIDAVSARKRNEALMLLETLLENGQSPLGIIALISKQLKTMLQCKEYTEKGYSIDRIISMFKLNPYVAKKCTMQSRGFTADQLKIALQQCLELDYNIKIGKTKEQLGLEMLIVNMCA